MQTIEDIIRTKVEFLSEDLLLTEAVEKILDADLPGLPVVGKDGCLIGFLSEHDCIIPLISDTYHCDSRTQVKELIHREPLSISVDDSIIDIAQMMASNKPKVYPVVKNNKPIGIVCRQDVLRALSEEMKHCKSYV